MRPIRPTTPEDVALESAALLELNRKLRDAEGKLRVTRDFDFPDADRDPEPGTRAERERHAHAMYLIAYGWIKGGTSWAAAVEAAWGEWLGGDSEAWAHTNYELPKPERELSYDELVAACVWAAGGYVPTIGGSEHSEEALNHWEAALASLGVPESYEAMTAE